MKDLQGTDSTILTQEDLAKIFGYRSPCKVREFMERNKIPFFIGRSGGIFTTMYLLNAAGIAQMHGHPQNDEIQLA